MRKKLTLWAVWNASTRFWLDGNCNESGCPELFWDKLEAESVATDGIYGGRDRKLDKVDLVRADVTFTKATRFE